MMTRIATSFLSAARARRAATARRDAATRSTSGGVLCVSHGLPPVIARARLDAPRRGRPGRRTRMLRLSLAMTHGASSPKQRGEIGGVGALVPEAGREDRRRRRERRRERRHRARSTVAPIDEPEARPLAVGAAVGVVARPRPRRRSRPEHRRAARCRPGALRGERLGIARGGEHEHALARALARGRTCRRAMPTPRNGFTVSASASSGDPGVSQASRVGVHRRADVAALGVGDHEEAGRARGREHVLERGEAGGAVALEERAPAA